MPYLDWTEKKPKQEVSQAQTMTCLSLELSDPLLQDLVIQLEDLFLSQGRELRLSLDHGWTLFWKRREDGARALLAHPESETWVATIGLEIEQGKRLISGLKSLEQKKSIVLGHQVNLGPVSNLDLVISRSS
jgi:hypothetical protein